MTLSLFEKLPDGLRVYQDRFLTISKQFAARHRLPAETPLSDGGAFEFDGAAMSLRYHPLLQPLHVTVAVDFGPSPVGDASEMRALLETNFVEFGNGAFYSVAPRTGHVVCFAAIGLDHLDVDGLERALGALAAAATGGGRR